MAVQPERTNELLKPYLSANQQDLLLAALNSQAGGINHNPRQTPANRTSGDQLSTPFKVEDSAMSSDETKALFMSPQDAELGNYDVDFTPDLDYLDGDSGFDFDNADLGGEMIGALPGSGDDDQDDKYADSGEPNEKRKSPDDQDIDEEGGDAKRQETQDGEKTAKKPGRKPLTSEPTTKRKAQNRAAQRAFRERKEKHLKDLETKVSEMTKIQEADKHENGLLKAQVERLQVELREYRKRLSLNNAGVSRSPPQSAAGSQHRSNSGQGYGSGFQFDFPKFGALPGSQIFGKQSSVSSNPSAPKRHSSTPSTSANSPPVSSRHGSQTLSRSGREDSMARSSLSPGSVPGTTSTTGSPAQNANLTSSFNAYSGNNNTANGYAGTLPQMAGAGDPFSNLFSPSILKSAGMDNYFGNTDTPDVNQNAATAYGDNSGGDNMSGFTRVFQFNGSSTVSDSTSPSGSSLSQWNVNGATNSSCETSPEPSHDSPANKDKVSDNYLETISPQMPFVDHSQRSADGFASQHGVNDIFAANHDYGIPSIGNFDPVLFGDYRDSNEAIVGNGDFTGGFFDDALNSTSLDYASPSNLFGILNSPQQVNKPLNTGNVTATNAPSSSKQLMAEMDKVRDGGDDDYGLPSTQAKPASGGNLISCNNIWNQLQSNPDFQDGKFDLDSLCSELRMKARCSETGVMVDRDHVNAAIKKLGKKDENGKVHDPPPLMFEQESWDKVLMKLGNSK